MNDKRAPEPPEHIDVIISDEPSASYGDIWRADFFPNRR